MARNLFYDKFVLADEEYKLDMLNTPYAKKKFHYDVEKMLYSSENIFGIVSWKKPQWHLIYKQLMISQRERRCFVLG